MRCIVVLDFVVGFYRVVLLLVMCEVMRLWISVGMVLLMVVCVVLEVWMVNVIVGFLEFW